MFSCVCISQHLMRYILLDDENCTSETTSLSTLHLIHEHEHDISIDSAKKKDFVTALVALTNRYSVIACNTHTDTHTHACTQTYTHTHVTSSYSIYVGRQTNNSTQFSRPNNDIYYLTSLFRGCTNNTYSHANISHTTTL